MTTVADLLGPATERLRAAGRETPRLDAELLLASALGCERTTLIAHPDAVVGPDAEWTFGGTVARRERGEPVAYIRGWKEFHGLALSVDPHVLIPRPETELIVDLAERELVERLTAAPRPMGAAPIRVADVGTGSGAIAVTVAVLLRRRGIALVPIGEASQGEVASPGEVSLVATDVSPDALAIARGNAVAHAVADRVAFVEADLLPVAERPFDLILANLPYVRTDALPGLPVATSYEPILALDGGPEGLDQVERLLGLLSTALVPGGVALLEIGADQGEAFGALAGRVVPGWRTDVVPDLAGLPRVARVDRPTRTGGGA